jgi:uncharacterized protein
MDLDPVEIRVLGCLVEKQRTTPDIYPLSLNSLRLACNQATNRDPVVDYDEETVRDALRRLALRGYTRLASGAGSRARKYRHLLDEALGLGRGELSLLAVLMLRGPQTPGELKQRVDRLHHFDGLAGVNEGLDRLIEAGHVARLERRPGQKEERYMQLLGTEDAPAGEDSDSGPALAEGQLPPPLERLAQVEREVAALREEMRALREALGEPIEALEQSAEPAREEAEALGEPIEALEPSAEPAREEAEALGEPTDSQP